MGVHRHLYRQSRDHCTQTVRRAKPDHIQSVLDTAGTGSQKMFSEVYGLLGTDSASPNLPEFDDQCAARTLCTFYEEKIQTIRTALEAEKNSSEH